MTYEEKANLRCYVKEGLSFEQIRKRVSCSDATIRKYIKGVTKAKATCLSRKEGVIE